MSSVKMFESISRECQPIFCSGESTQESVFYKKEVQAVWPYKTKNREENSLKDPE